MAIIQSDVDKKMRDILSQEIESRLNTEKWRARAREIRRGKIAGDMRMTIAAMLEAYHLGRAHQRDGI